MRILLLGLFLVLTTSPYLWAADEAKRLVALVDYIGGDYQNAVRDRTIINEDEYQEMIEFSSRSLELFEQLKAREKTDPAGIEADLRRLAVEIKGKGDVEIVTVLARQIKDRLIATYKIVTFPSVLPRLSAGRAVYKESCAQCHGEGGRGDGPSVATMQPKEPKPANFTDAELISGLSPFKAFNTTTFGIEGTAMPDFSALDESERWQAAFYIFSLRFSDGEAADGKKLFEARQLPDELKTPKMLATLSDEELLARLQLYHPREQEALKVVAYLRRGLLEEGALDPLVFARAALAEALKLYRDGATESAYQKSVEAYLDGFELSEPTLFARDPAFARGLEAQFAEFRTAVKRGDPFTKVQDLYSEIEAGLARASESLADQDSLSGGYVFLNSAVIILREGIEAALIVAAIVALLKGLGAVHAMHYVHLGWTLALLAGFVTWALAQTILAIGGNQRETIEGFTTLTAAVVLFYVSYWLIANTEAKRWQRFIHDKVQHALVDKKRVFALVGVSFFAVYREAFETVLFYQALWLQSAAARSLLVWGFLAGLAILLIVVFAIFKLGLRIPLRKFFGGTSALLFMLAFVFAGEGIRELQTAGWLPVTPVGFPPSIGPLGIYPTVESLLAQGAMLTALIIAVVWLSREYWSRAKGGSL